MGRNREVDLTIITGLSGAGRSEAAKALEDFGWFVIDNLPPTLIDTFITLLLDSKEPARRVAVVIDARGGQFFREAWEALARLRRDVTNFRMIYLEASDEILVRRFESTRRKHPLDDERVAAGIQRERDLMHHFREGADLILDTTDLTVRQLRARLAAYFEDEDPSTDALRTTIISFGYKFGIPLDSDILLDVRFLPNPHWVDELRELTGREEAVRHYVLEQGATGDFLKRAEDLFDVLLRGYQSEGRHFLTVAVGCTGGRHRSVVLAEALGDFMRERGYPVRVIHRDVEHPAAGP